MLRVEALRKSFVGTSGDPVVAVDGVSFAVGRGGMFGILGPSGCGKTTLLRAIAGLESPEAGSIAIDGATIFSHAAGINLAPNRRNVSLVFQSYAIWPHLSVFENVAFPLRVRGVDDRLVKGAVERVLEDVSLADLAGRPSTALSGGQQQRLALARAIVSKPKLLLLDEPLSNLDAKLRQRMRVELKRLQEEHHVTTVFVTHDQDEALSLADKVAIMDKGRLLQVGSPQELYEAPSSLAVANFVGSINLVTATFTGRRDDAGAALFSCEWGELAAQVEEALPPSAQVILGIRPESVRVNADGPAPNRFRGEVTRILYYGDRQTIAASLGGVSVSATVPPHIRLKAGDIVVLSMASADVKVISADPA